MFFVFIFALIKSDEPTASKDVPSPKVVEAVESKEPIESGEYLYRLSLTSDESYVVVASKAKELGASLDYFNKNKLTAVISVNKKYSQEEWMTHLKRKFLNSNIEEIDVLSLEKEKRTEFIGIDNTATFYSPSRELFFSMPLTWTSEFESDVYSFLDASKQVVLKVTKHNKENSSSTEFISNHLSSSAENQFILDGDVERTDKGEGVVFHRWILTNNNIFVPQGIVETPSAFYFFDSQQYLSFDDFMLVFDSSQVF